MLIFLLGLTSQRYKRLPLQLLPTTLGLRFVDFISVHNLSEETHAHHDRNSTKTLTQESSISLYHSPLVPTALSFRMSSRQTTTPLLRGLVLLSCQESPTLA